MQQKLSMSDATGGKAKQVQSLRVHVARPTSQIWLHRLVILVGLSVFGLFAFFPIYWMALTSVTPIENVFKFPPSLAPQTVTLEFYAEFFRNPTLLRYLGNSFLVSILTALLSLVVATYAGYSFSKYRYRGRRSLMFLILSAQMFPQALLLITLYLLFAQLKLTNTYTVLILSFSTFTLPLCIWTLKNFFDTLPDDLIEAARVDGARPFQIIHQVMVPLALPALVSTALFAFIRGWNDYIFALTLAGPEHMTLPPGLALAFIGEFQTAWPSLMAASLVVSLPIIVLFIFLQRYIVSGLSAGAVKG